MNELNLPAKAYIAGIAITAFGLAAFLTAQSTLPGTDQIVLIVLITVLVTAAITFPLKIAAKTNLSLHLSAVFAATLLFRPGIAMIAVGLGSVIAHVLRRLPWKETIFNSAEVMLQAGLGGLVLLAFGWNFTALSANSTTLIPVVVAVAVIVYLVEFLSVAIIVALQTSQPLPKIWQQSIHFDTVEVLAQFALGMIAALLAEVQLWALPLLIPPALVVYRSTQRHLNLREQAKVLHYQALHDSLTGLPNRALFIDRVDHALARLTREEAMLAVLFLDLDRFKVINDSLGHDIGDQLLVSVARRLEDVLRPSDTVARLGGDEFTILAEGLTRVDDAVHMAERIIESFQQSFTLADHDIIITTSIGIAMGTSSQVHTEDLLRDADVAMYRAKDTGKDRYAIFKHHMRLHTQTRLQQEYELRRACERQELLVYYQPIVDLEADQIVAVEALVRWEHPEHGIISPAQFIPLAEETGLIRQIGRWVLEQACRQMQAWNTGLLREHPIYISVNVSAEQIKQPQLVDEIAQTLADTGLDPQYLQLELTESILLNDTMLTLNVLDRLRRLGIRIAIDDFGTGYSSLGYLKRFPVEIVKLDRDFVDGLGRDQGDTAIVRTVSLLAQMLGMGVVAEGIENHDQIEHLKQLGYTLGQGYYFSRPLPGRAIETVLRHGLVSHPVLQMPEAS